MRCTAGRARCCRIRRSLKSMWLTHWDFSAGLVYADAVHQLDIARWLVGNRHPEAVSLTGGVLIYKDKREFPDTLTAAYLYDNVVITLNDERLPVHAGGLEGSQF